MQTCECNESLNNTGTANCIPIFRVARKIFAVPTYDSAGVRNSVTVADTIDDAYLTARLNDTDPTQRWYPLPALKNVTSDRSEDVYESAPDNSKSFVQNGVRTFSGEIWGQGPEYKRKLDALRCSEVSIFIIDKEGNLRGVVDKDSDLLLYPIRTDQNSWNTKLILGTDTTNEKLLVSFDWDQIEEDGLLRVIAAGDMTADLASANGLLDINMTVGVITSTTVSVKLYTDYGSLKEKIVDSGLVITDFVSSVTGATSKIRNTSVPSDVTITAFVEAPNGTYLLTFAAQTSADVMKIKVVKNGRDYTLVTASTFVIP